MKIAIDLQACQTSGSRLRGIGRFSMELAKAIIQHRGRHTIHFMLNQAFDEQRDALTEDLGTASGVTFESYRLLGIGGAQDDRKRELQRINDEILNWRYACTGADVLHVSSVFEGWLAGDAHVSGRIADVPSAIKSATLYDLIPLLFSETYLGEATRADYMARLGVFQQLDLVCAISESARQDAINRLGLLPDRVVNIGAAASRAFHRMQALDPETTRDALLRLGLGTRMILYVGGIDHRKNIPFALKAYAALPARIRADVQLAVVCAVSQDERSELLGQVAALGIEGRVVFTGFVPDGDLNLLYNACELFIFPSLYEGFGLPLLEAMTCGACVIASNTSSMPEIVGRSDVLFDPADSDALTRMMLELLGDPERRRDLAEYNLRRSREFSWDRVACTMLHALEESVVRRNATSSRRAGSCRPRMALVSPLPPQRSGIADYSASMLPYWSRQFDLDLLAGEYEPSLDDVMGAYRVIELSEFRRCAHDYDVILYHFGNSQFHTGMYDLLPQYPGIVVLHDFFLSGLVHHLDAEGGQTGLFHRELTSAHGDAAASDIESVGRGEIQIDDLKFRYSVSRRVIQNARGLIFHSRFAQGLLADTYPDLAGVPNCVVPQACFVRIEPGERTAARLALGLENDDLLVCAFGFLVETKDNHLLLEALSDRRLADDRRVQVMFVGQLDPGPVHARLHALIANHPMRDRIRITGYVDERDYRRYLAACDIGVSLRSKSRGETSAAMQKQLAAGCATIVSDYAAMSELPDDVVRKVPSNDAGALAMALKTLAGDALLRARLGEAARRWILASCHPVMVAEQYADAISALTALDRARCAAGLARRIGALVERDRLGPDVTLAAGEAIAAGLALHPAGARWLPRQT